MGDMGGDVDIGDSDDWHDEEDEGKNDEEELVDQGERGVEEQVDMEERDYIRHVTNTNMKGPGIENRPFNYIAFRWANGKLVWKYFAFYNSFYL